MAISDRTTERFSMNRRRSRIPAIKFGHLVSCVPGCGQGVGGSVQQVQHGVHLLCEFLYVEGQLSESSLWFTAGDRIPECKGTSIERIQVIEDRSHLGKIRHTFTFEVLVPPNRLQYSPHPKQ